MAVTLALVGVLFVVIFLTGYWLNQSGRPINGLKLNLHKLIALGALAYLGVMINRANQAAGLSAGEWAVVAAGGVLFLATIVTGGLVSLEKPAAPPVCLLHKVLPFLTLAASAAVLGVMYG